MSLIAAIEEDLAAPVPLLGPLLLLRSRIADQLSPFLLATYDHSPGITLDPDSDPALDTVLAPPPTWPWRSLSTWPSRSRVPRQSPLTMLSP